MKKLIALFLLLFATSAWGAGEITSLTALSESPATGDTLEIVDVNDTTYSANGTNKKITITNLFTTPNLVTPSFNNGSTGGGYFKLMEDSDNGTDYSTITGAADAGSFPAFTFGGSQGSEDLTLTAAANKWTWSTSSGVTEINHSAINLVTTGYVSAAINVVSDGDDHTVSATEAYGGFGVATGTGTWTLPAAATGMNFCVYSTTAAAVHVDVDAGDTITLNGAALSAGDKITSASGAGDFVCLLAVSTSSWITLGRSGVWTDGN